MNESNVLNQFVLTGKLVAKSVLRYSPAGIPVCEFEIEHESERLEAAILRLVHCVVSAVAMGAAALETNQLGLGIEKQWSGFITLRSHKSKSLQFHVCGIRNI